MSGDVPTTLSAKITAHSDALRKIVSFTGHHGAVNSQALARAVNEKGVIVGITRETLVAEFVAYRDTIGVDAGGEPNGELHETARELVQPPPWGSLAGLPKEFMPKVAAKLLSCWGKESCQIKNPLSY